MNKNKTYARIFIIIPIVLVAILLISFVIATILEQPTDRGMIYSLFAFISIIGFLLIPVPCGVLAVLGLVNAIKAMREESGMVPYIIVAIVEIVLAILCCLICLYVIFVAGPSV